MLGLSRLQVHWKTQKRPLKTAHRHFRYADYCSFGIGRVADCSDVEVSVEGKSILARLSFCFDLKYDLVKRFDVVVAEVVKSLPAVQWMASLVLMAGNQMLSAREEEYWYG